MKIGGFGDGRIRRLIEERARIDAQISRHTSRQWETRRKRELRRFLVAGEVVLRHAARDEAFAKTLFNLLSEVLKGRDRALFELNSDVRNAFASASADYRDESPDG
ncbi:hypothetical protein AB6B38_07515 [Glycocaulis abyssi]|uniref:Mobilization protein n=1 Tax=Glycocaulis abyssi TaxID=1433403 RepID=A0ABV9NHN0_9PROT